MKKTLLLLAIIPVLVCVGAAQGLSLRRHLTANQAPPASSLSEVWSPKAEGLLPAEYNVADICIVNGQVIWAVAFDWAPVYNGQPVPAGAIPKLLKSNDGGETWTVTNIEEAQGRVVWDIQVFDENTACIVSQNLSGSAGGKGIFRTTDGGETWIETYSGTAGGGALHFFNDQEGVCINFNGGKHIARTTDGGVTWALVPPGNIPNLLSGEASWFSSSSNALGTFGDIACFGTTKGRLIKTNDRGLTWQATSTGLGNNSILISQGFANEKNGLAVAWLDGPNTYEIVTTTDGGLTWAHTGNFDYNEVDAVPCSGIFMATTYWGDQRSAISSDFGTTWAEVDSTIDAAGAVFSTPEHGWMIETAEAGVGTGPALYKWIGDPLFGRIYVDKHATGANNGRGWSNAFTDLQTALSTAVAGDEIWVAEGTYTPAAPGGSANATFTINKNIRLYGGYAGTECNLPERDIVLHPTILSGDLNGNDVDDDFSATWRSDNVSHVVSITAAATSGTVVDGFAIQGGQADGGGTPNGGGINCFGAPVIRNCILRQNFCFGGGAALRVSGAGGQGLMVDHCRFEKNLAANASGTAGGGGMDVDNVKNAGVVIRDCIFMDNTADWMGGLSIQNSNALIEGTAFSGNFTKRHGGGLRVGADVGNDNLTFKLRNCTFQNNEASFGGGMYALLRSKKCMVDISHTKFIGNAVKDMQLTGWGQSYGGLGFAFPATASDIQVRIDSCLFEGNATATNHSAIGLSSSGSNISVSLANSTFRQNTCTFYATVGLWPGSDNTLDATVENCLFENNISQYASAGLDIGTYLEGNDANYTVRNCVFRNNQAALIGGGLTLWANKGSKANFNMEDCLLEGNSAGEHAGGVWILTGCDDFSARFNRCIFRDNDSPWGSALGAYQFELTEYILPKGAVVTIENSLMEGNASSAAIALDSFPGLQLINTTIAHNHGGIQVSDSSGISLQNTILYNPGYAEYQALTNDATFISNGGNLIGDGSLNGQLLPSDRENLDPVFIGPDDYHLGMGSPGINHGVDLGNLAALDLEGNTRVVGSAVDIGAYENQTVAVQEELAGEVAVSPNPAAAFLNIQLPEAHAGPFNIEIFDALGRCVHTQARTTGQNIDVRRLAAGVYTLKAAMGERVYAGKFVRQ